jgi:hypothetical protein
MVNTSDHMQLYAIVTDVKVGLEDSSDNSKTIHITLRK